MSEEDLQLLITLDDPVEAPEEDSFNHRQAKNILEYWLGQRLPAGCRLDQRAESVGDSDVCKVTFGQGDWTCTVSRLVGTTNVSMKGVNANVAESPNDRCDIEVCTVTQIKNGEIVERKMFYALAATPQQIEVM